MKAINQHKSMAMGNALAKYPARKAAFAAGGAVPTLRSGIPTSPVTDMKRADGVLHLKRGGKSGG